VYRTLQRKYKRQAMGLVDRLKHSFNSSSATVSTSFGRRVIEINLVRPSLISLEFAYRPAPNHTSPWLRDRVPGPCAHPGLWFLPLRRESRLSLSSFCVGRCPHAPSSLTASVCSSLTQSLFSLHLCRPEGHPSRLSLRLQASQPSVPPPTVL
jgi:hypothetical protein